jgi:5-methylcytosine-specific restriction endonuclease McrA
MSGWSGGSTRSWRRIRAAVLERDLARARRTGEPWCRLRVPGVCVQVSEPMHVHHVHGKAHGDDTAHLLAACQPCNLHIGDPTKNNEPAITPVTNWR